MKLARFLIPLALLAMPLHAADRSPADRLLDTMDFEVTAMAAAKNAFNPVLEKFKDQGLPPEAISELRNAADAYFDKTFNDPEFRATLVKLYQERFTADEIEDLIRFYNTPVGRKSVKAIPELMSEASQLGKKFAQKNSADFQAEVTDIMLKYKGGAKAPKKAAPDAGKAPKDKTPAQDDGDKDR